MDTNDDHMCRCTPVNDPVQNLRCRHLQNCKVCCTSFTVLCNCFSCGYLGANPRGGKQFVCFFLFHFLLFLCLNPYSNNVLVWKRVIKVISQNEWLKKYLRVGTVPAALEKCWLVSISCPYHQEGSTGVRTCFLFFASGKPVSQWASSPVSSISCCSVLAEMVQYHRCLLQLLILKNISLSLFGNLLWERSIHIKHQRHTFKAAM